MSFGLQILNQSGELTISSNARMLHYIAKPILVGGPVQVSGRADGTRSSNPRVAGYSVYRLWYNQPFIIGMDVPVGTRHVGVISITEPWPGVHDITMYCGDVVDADGFDTNQYPVDIYAFGFIGGAPSSYWGLALYDSSGALSADFTRPHPLWPQAIVDVYNNPNRPIPYLSRPIVLGMPSKFSMAHVWRPTGMLYDYIDQMDMWNRPNATTLTANSRKLKQYQISEQQDEEGGGNGPSPAIIIEGANLPNS
jgi:hypothetical protein